MTVSRNILLSALLLLAQPGYAGPDAVLYSHEFADESSQRPPREYLEAQGFVLKHDIDDDDRILLGVDDSGLTIHTLDEAFGLMFHEEDIHGAGRLRLHWGILDYPDGASYERGIDNEALMVYVFFGDEKFSSGSMLLPKSPYFIGFYLCEAGADELDRPYLGHHYQKAGRFICVGHPPQGELTITEIDLHEEFRRSFALERAPSVTGISVEVDTTDSRNDGHAAAVLRRMEFLP